MLRTFFGCTASFVLTFLFLTFLSGSVLAASGTVVLKSGERLDYTEYVVDYGFKVLKLTVQGEKRAVSFADIEAIVDLDGKDITNQVIGAKYKSPAQQSFMSSRSEEYRRLSSKPWNFGIHFGGTFTIPSGDYYLGINEGIGWRGDVILPLNDMLALRGTVSMAGARINPSEFLGVGSAFTILSSDLDIDVVRYFLSIQYFAPWRGGNIDKNYWFVYSGLGITSNSVSGESLLRENGTGDLWMLSGDFSESKFSLTFGLGTTPMISRTLGVELGASADVVFIGRSEPDYGVSEVQAAGNIDFRVGLIYLFPRK